MWKGQKIFLHTLRVVFMLIVSANTSSVVGMGCFLQLLSLDEEKNKKKLDHFAVIANSQV